MKATFIVLLAVLLCVGGCGKKKVEQTAKEPPKTKEAPEKSQPKPPPIKPGTPIWEFPTWDEVHSSPAIGPDGTVYVGSNDKRLYALNGKTGIMQWRFFAGKLMLDGSHLREKGLLSSPAIGADGTVYIGSWDKKVYALNGQTGAKKWEFETNGNVYSSPAIGVDGTVYIGSMDGKVYALQGKTGDKKWEFATEPTRSVGVYSSPAIGKDGTVYIGSLDKKIYALDGQTGTKKWEFVTRHYVDSSPAIGADGTIYVGSWDRRVYALDGKTGVKKWEFKTGSEMGNGDNVRSSPVIGADGTVYVGSMNGWVYALHGQTGAKKWEFKAGRRVASSPAIGADGTVYIGSKVSAKDAHSTVGEGKTDGDTKAPTPIPLFEKIESPGGNKVYALDGKTGAMKWEFETGGWGNSSPAIGSDGTVYIGSMDGKVYAIKTDSKGLAKSPWPMRGQNIRHTSRLMNKETPKLQAETKPTLTLEEKKFVGEYKGTGDFINYIDGTVRAGLGGGWHGRMAFLVNGIANPTSEPTSPDLRNSYGGEFGFLRWQLSENKEVHAENKYGQVFIGRINSDSSFTLIAWILGEKRIDLPKEKQITYKRCGKEEAVSKVETKNPEPTKAVPANIADPIVEKAIRERLKKPTGELTEADLEKVTSLELHNNQLTKLPEGLEKLTQLELLVLNGNNLTDVKGLEKLTQLKQLFLADNPDLTKSQIDELQKALPCKIWSNAKK